MPLIVKEDGGTSFPIIDQGMHHSVCYGIYDLGTHHNPIFDNRSRKVLVCWELPEERIEIEKDGEKKDLPRAISKQYTLSLHEKANLRKDLESWRGKSFTSAELEGFDITKLLGVNCMLQVIHRTKNEKTYANIASIVPLYGKQKVEPENPIRFFSFEDNMDIPEGTPEWIEKKIKESDEWEARMTSSSDDKDANMPPVGAYDDIPF